MTQSWLSKNSLALLLKVLALSAGLFPAQSSKSTTSTPLPGTPKRILETRTDTTCAKPRTRTEWRRLPNTQKTSFLSAVKCLMDKPARESIALIPAVANRFEDFAATHIVQAVDMHLVGAFYPYHRWLLYNFEDEIQDCGYTGGLPYWDWTLDTAGEDDFPNSPIFDPITGFGGNGQYVPSNSSIQAPTMFLAPPVAIANRSGGGCIMTGPFAGLSTQLGAGDNIQKKGQHCVTRDLTYSYLLLGASPANLSWAMALPDYGWFNNVTEVSYHASGHWSVGGLYGTMTDMWASALDPLFYLHHANVDRAWWSWQSRNLAVREFDISGPLVAEDYNNARAGNLTLDARIHIGVTNELDVAVSDVMHIQKRALCYTFDQLY